MPGRWKAFVFDLDGVITRTAAVHFAAWKELFDGVLVARAARDGTSFDPFTHADYLAHVDGKPRYEGVRDFLASRAIALPWGDPADDPAAETVCGLGNRKNRLFTAHLKRDGAKVFTSSVAFLDHLRRAGRRTAIVSSSRNCRAVLDSAGLAGRFDRIIDGRDAEELGLAGKPRPDTFVAAARALEADPAETAIFEDATAGIAAGRAGGFGLVVGVDRGAGREALLAAGADLVVADLGDLLRD